MRTGVLSLAFAAAAAPALAAPGGWSGFKWGGEDEMYEPDHELGQYGKHPAPTGGSMKWIAPTNTWAYNNWAAPQVKSKLLPTSKSSSSSSSSTNSTSVATTTSTLTTTSKSSSTTTSQPSSPSPDGPTSTDKTTSTSATSSKSASWSDVEPTSVETTTSTLATMSKSKSKSGSWSMDDPTTTSTLPTTSKSSSWSMDPTSDDKTTITLATTSYTTICVTTSTITASRDPSKSASPVTLSSSTSIPSKKHSVTTLSSSSSSPSYTASNTSAVAYPTSTGKCVPCEGQPGSDPATFCGLDINSNYYEVAPNTCKTVTYDFEITEDTNFAPDGVSRMGLLVNGQMPGPMLEASWGDWVIVNVHNKLTTNGTSIHFHGIRQYYTNEMDGVPSITQCPIAPGESMTYKWRATNYGTSWYHSHYAIQTYEGVFGPMIIHGPHSGGNYTDEQMIVLQDWNHTPVDEFVNTIQDAVTGGPPTLDTGLINGMNTFGADGSSSQVGKRFQMNVTQGSTYLLRIVNTAIQSSFKFYIDGHKFKVISNDFVPITPYETDILNVQIGQRYNVLVTFDQPVSNYWMRSDNQDVCAKLVNSDDIKAIVHYEGASTGNPTSTAYSYTPACVDEPYASLVPIVPINAGAKSQEVDETVTIGADNGTPNLFKWTLSGTTFQSSWNDPTLVHIVENGTAPTYSGQLAIDVPTLGEWVYVIIESPIPLPHPIHLHGHDFLILAQGTGLYSSSTKLNTVNPPRRDVALMPYDGSKGKGGYLVLAFPADNPGAWLMHCHVGWHVAMGFALQIIENESGVADTVLNKSAMKDTCAAWNSWAAANDIEAAPYESGV